MATQPTQNQVPSESPRDLKFNAGKIDEFVTSIALKYKDRFGLEHYTIEGLRDLIYKAIHNLGWLPYGDFDAGATLSTANQVLLNANDGEYYKWGGYFPKHVPANSTPQSTGGFGVSAWSLVGDGVLRTELSKGQYRSDATSCYYVAGFIIDTITNNRNAAYTFPGAIYVPEGTQLRCNFLPEDDVRKFIGEGSVLTKDPWGHEHVFDLKKSANGSCYTCKEIIHQTYRDYSTKKCRIGFHGDSITDGAWGKQSWTPNPTTGTPLYNLNSTNYDHNSNGGSRAWPAHAGFILNSIIARWTDIAQFVICNTGSTGMKLSDGWAYRNFDYGYFQNAAYENKAPDVIYITMGWNDFDADFDSYMDKIDAIIRKAWGYGCAVGFVTTNQNQHLRAAFESAAKRNIIEKYKRVEFIDLSEALRRVSGSNLKFNALYYQKSDNTLDVTHPQPLGHMVMGNAMVYEICKDSFIPTVSNNDMLLTPSADNFWSCIGVTSGTHYQIQQDSAGGTTSLDKIGWIAAAATNPESVVLQTMVWCERDNMTLSLLEPYSSSYSTNSGGEIIVQSPAGLPSDQDNVETTRGIISGDMASKRYGMNKTLTTYAGKLSYGLNLITIKFGAGTKHYIPSLKFGSLSSDGWGFSPLRLNVTATSLSPLISPTNKSSDGILKNIYDGSSYSNLPDWFASVGSLVGYVEVLKPLTSTNGIAVFFNPDTKNGLLIRRNVSLLETATVTAGVVSVFSATALDGTKPFKVFLYYGTTNSVVIQDQAGAEATISTTFSGGVVGTFTGTGSGDIFTLTAASTTLF